MRIHELNYYKGPYFYDVMMRASDDNPTMCVFVKGHEKQAEKR